MQKLPSGPQSVDQIVRELLDSNPPDYANTLVRLVGLIKWLWTRVKLPADWDELPDFKNEEEARRVLAAISEYFSTLNAAFVLTQGSPDERQRAFLQFHRAYLTLDGINDLLQPAHRGSMEPFFAPLRAEAASWVASGHFYRGQFDRNHYKLAVEKLDAELGRLAASENSSSRLPYEGISAQFLLLKMRKLECLTAYHGNPDEPDGDKRLNDILESEFDSALTDSVYNSNGVHSPSPFATGLPAWIEKSVNKHLLVVDPVQMEEYRTAIPRIDRRNSLIAQGKYLENRGFADLVRLRSMSARRPELSKECLGHLMMGMSAVATGSDARNFSYAINQNAYQKYLYDSDWYDEVAQNDLARNTYYAMVVGVLVPGSVDLEGQADILRSLLIKDEQTIRNPQTALRSTRTAREKTDVLGLQRANERVQESLARVGIILPDQ